MPFDGWPLDALQWLYDLAMRQDLKIVHPATTGSEVRVELNRPLDHVEKEDLKDLQRDGTPITVDTSNLGAPRQRVGGHLTVKTVPPGSTLVFKDPKDLARTKLEMDRLQGILDQINGRRRLREEAAARAQADAEAARKEDEDLQERTNEALGDWLRKKT